LQNQTVQRDQRQPVIAFGAQSTLAPELHQDGLAVGHAFHQGQPPVDVLAIRARGEEQQIDRLGEQARGERDEQIDQINRVEFEHG
jgi:hypothetical protein